MQGLEDTSGLRPVREENNGPRLGRGSPGGTFLAGSRSEAHWLVNAGLALRGIDNRWQLSAECVNCFNEEFVQSALSNTTYINQPGTWMVRAKVNFK